MSNQKGTALVGGAATEEVIASSDSIFTPGAHGGQKGLQQFFTPDKAAQLAKSIIGPYCAVLDPTAGDGSFLRAFDPPYSFGVEIDHDQVDAATGSYHAIKGDLQHVYPLLRLGMPEWDAIVANPPFSLMWEDPTVNDGKPTSSAVMAFIYASRLLAETGQLVFIDGKSHFYRAIADRPEARGIYAVIEVDDMFEGTSTPCVMAFGITPQNREDGKTSFETRNVPLDMLDLAADWVKELRKGACGGYDTVANHTYGYHTLPDTMKAIQGEYNRRVEHRLGKAKREYDAQLVGGASGAVQWLPSAFTTIALRNAGDYYAFQGLNGQSVNYFVQNERLWNKLASFEEQQILRIDPRLRDAVENLLGEIKKVICPLYSIKPQQRLGYLADVEFIRCTEDDPEKGFVKGEDYRINTKTKTIVTEEDRVVESKKNPGEYETRRFRKQQKVMEITIGHHSILDGGERASEQIGWLIDHFFLPDPGEVATKHPDDIAQAEAEVQAVLDVFAENSLAYEAEHPEVYKYSHRRFQKRDIARLLFKGGGLLSWEQGLGKTLGGLAFAEAAVRRGAQDARLFITAKDLIPQWQRELKRFYGREATVITTHGQAKKIARSLRQPENGGLYITYYEALSLVGTKKSQAEDHFTVFEREDHKQVRGTGRYGYYWIEEVAKNNDDPDSGEPVATERIYHPCKGHYDESIDLERAVCEEDGRAKVNYGYIPDRYETILKAVTTREVCPECRADVRNGWNGLYCEAEKPDGTKCSYAHYKVRVRPISSLLSGAFKRGVIVMDEITLIQGDTSARSRALRGLKAKYRLGMTGTPIKNFVAQAFWLLWWCLGNGSKRFGYTYEGGRTKFENDFSVVEWTMDNRGKLQNRKALPEVTNLSMLWRLLASSIIRRRKEETGEELVPKFYYPIRVPLGVAQREQINKWLKDFPKLFAEKYPDSKVVKANMHEIMAPMLGLQQKLDYACTVPLADPDWEWTGIEVSNYTPATLRVIELAMALAKQGRKVLVGSNLVKTSAFVADTLNSKGVSAIHILDEAGNTLDPDKRASRVYSFQTDEVQVFCAGVKAIRLGHNLDAANAVILHGLDWDYETLDQFINRVHRLTSKEPIDIYIVMPTADQAELSAAAGGTTITEKKWSILEQKGDAAALALDGRLIEKHELEVDVGQIVREMMERGITDSEDHIPEEVVQEAWEGLALFENYEAPEGLIPERPSFCPIAVEQYFDGPIGPEWPARTEAIEAVATFIAEVAKLPVREVEAVPVELVLAQNAAEMEAQTPDDQPDHDDEPGNDEVMFGAGDTDDELPIEDADDPRNEVFADDDPPADAVAEAVEAIEAEIEADSTKSADLAPAADSAVMAALAAMQAQLAELTAKQAATDAENAELRAEVERLSNHEQLTLSLETA